MSTELDFQDTDRVRLLMPSFLTYGIIGSAIVAFWLVTALVLNTAWMVKAAVAGAGTSFLLVKPISEWLASMATEKKLGASVFFEIDIAGEKEILSQLRAKRVSRRTISRDER